MVNLLYRLESNEIGHIIFKNPLEQDLEDALKGATWPGTRWDKTSIGKYQLFSHNLYTDASVRLVFVKKKIMPTRHDNTISMDRIMLIYCIMEELAVNVGKIICEHILA